MSGGVIKIAHSTALKNIPKLVRFAPEGILAPVK